MNPTASLRVSFALLGLLFAPLVSRSAEEFPLGPDSKVQPGVPMRGLRQCCRNLRDFNLESRAASARSTNGQRTQTGGLDAISRQSQRWHQCG